MKSTNYKNKMQNVSFRNVEEFLEFLPDDELIIVKKHYAILFLNVVHI